MQARFIVVTNVIVRERVLHGMPSKKPVSLVVEEISCLCLNPGVFNADLTCVWVATRFTGEILDVAERFWERQREEESGNRGIGAYPGLGPIPGVHECRHPSRHQPRLSGGYFHVDGTRLSC
jgi:hypothetical protein